jgi:hypothetical protein
MPEFSTYIDQQSRWKTEGTEYAAPYLRLRQVAALVNELHPESLLDLGCAEGYLRELCPGISYAGVDFVPLAHPGAFRSGIATSIVSHFQRLSRTLN